MSGVRLWPKTFSTPYLHSCRLGGMFVRLGSAYYPHRAHVVRGVLEAHGIPVEIWHEQALHLYMPGWEPCSVMIPEDDVEAALEVMNARPEELLPEEGGEEPAPAFQKYPGFLDWAIAVAAMLLFVGVSQVVGAIWEELDGSRFGGYHAGRIHVVDLMLYLVAVVPLGGLMGAAILKLCMVPLVICEGNKWMGLLAYLWVQWLLSITVSLAIGFVSEVVRLGNR